jgi:hypothetical protein
MPDGVTITTQAACPTCATLFGNSGLGILPGPGQVNFDFSILKTTRITERTTFQLRAEFFNLLNHPQFANLDPGLGTGGSVSQLPQPFNAGAGTSVATSVNPRIIQLGGKFIFQAGLRRGRWVEILAAILFLSLAIPPVLADILHLS